MLIVFFLFFIIIICIALAIFFQKRQKPETPAWEARMNVGGLLVVPIALIGATALWLLMLFES